MPQTSPCLMTVLIAGEDSAVAECREIFESRANELVLNLRIHEFMDVAVAASWLQQLLAGELTIALLIPSLGTWSRLPHFNHHGRPYLRSAEYPWGLPWVNHDSEQFPRLQKAKAEILN